MTTFEISKLKKWPHLEILVQLDKAVYGNVNKKDCRKFQTYNYLFNSKVLSSSNYKYFSDYMSRLTICLKY